MAHIDVKGEVDPPGEMRKRKKAVRTTGLAGQALLIEAVVRRVLLRYQEHLIPDDAHRRSLQVVLNDLPSLVIGAIREVGEQLEEPKPRTRW